MFARMVRRSTEVAVRGRTATGGDIARSAAERRIGALLGEWIRISATVERRKGEPVRLFGIKQDITEERRLLARMSYLAEHDAMTGLANRTRFDERLSQIFGAGAPGGALMLIDCKRSAACAGALSK
jgi:predicted signal transduction protein with EAL and GGDEF domain